MSDGSAALHAFQRNLLRRQTLLALNNYSLLLDPTSRYEPRVLPTNDNMMATLFSPQKCYGVKDNISVDPHAFSRLRFAQYEQRHSLATNRGKEAHDNLMNYALLKADNVKLITDRLEGHRLAMPVVPEPIRRKQPNPVMSRPLSRIDRINQYKEKMSQHLAVEELPFKFSVGKTPRIYESCDVIKNTNIINLHLVKG